MKKFASIGLLGLLLCHMLAHVLVAWVIGWQEKSDLTSRLSVYRSVDNLVEFYVPLHLQTADGLQTQPTDGFVYKDNYYDIVRQEIKKDTLLIVGYSSKHSSFWQQDLLDFVKYQFGEDLTGVPQKAYHLLKNFLTEYYQGVRFVISFGHFSWREPVPVLPFTAPLLTLSIPIHSPPPEA